MKATRVIFLGCLLAVVAGCSSKPKDLIIGRWEPIEHGGDVSLSRLEFKQDGAVVRDSKFSDKYIFIEDDIVEFELSPSSGHFFAGDKRTQEMKIKVTRENLTMTDENGFVYEYKRAL